MRSGLVDLDLAEHNKEHMSKALVKIHWYGNKKKDEKERQKAQEKAKEKAPSKGKDKDKQVDDREQF